MSMVTKDCITLAPGETYTAQAIAMCDNNGWTYKSDGIGAVSPGTALYYKENKMNLSADYEGKIKRIGKQFLLQLGCQEYICQDLKAVGVKITAVLTEEYDKKPE